MGGHAADAPIGAVLLRYLDGVDGGSDDKAAPRPAALKPTSRNVPEKRAGLCLVDAAGVRESVSHGNGQSCAVGAHIIDGAIVTGRVCRAAGIG